MYKIIVMHIMHILYINNYQHKYQFEEVHYF